MDKLLEFTKIFAKFAGFIFLIYLCFAPFFTIKGLPIHPGDALDNVATSYHLWQKNIFSYDGTHKTYEREPLPSYLTALYVEHFSQITKSTTLQQFNEDKAIIKNYLRINAWLSVLLILTTFGLCYLLSRSYFGAILGAGLVWLFFIYNRNYLANLLTELHAAILLLFISIGAYLLINRPSIMKAIFLGFCLALFSLTKATGLYISLPFLIVIFICLFKSTSSTHPFKHATLHSLVIAIVFCSLTIPWMVRNYTNFGEFAIAQRGGIVLLTRAIKNQMTSNEYRGAWYVYAPESLKPLLEKIFNFDQNDLKKGGQFERLVRRHNGDWRAEIQGRPDLATSYFSKAFAIQQSVKMELYNISANKILDKEMLPELYLNNVIVDQRLLDKTLKSKALSLITQNPVNHLITTPLFAWRGMWSFNTSLWQVNLICFVSFFFVSIIAILKKQYTLIAFCSFGAILFCFYAGATHFISRYSAPLIPLTIATTIYLLSLLLNKVLLKRLIHI